MLKQCESYNNIIIKVLSKRIKKQVHISTYNVLDEDKGELSPLFTTPIYKSERSSADYSKMTVFYTDHINKLSNQGKFLKQ